MLRKNLNVFFEIDMMTDMRNWQSVIVYRKFEELKNEEAKKREISFFGRVFSLIRSSTIHAYGYEVTGKNR